MKVGILSPGDMGSAVGNILAQGGVEVFTSLAGRGELTRLRAKEAGIRDAGSLDSLVAEVDLILSILVPSEAVPVAEAIAASMVRTGARPAVADCNAVAPRTARKMDEIIRVVG